MELTIRPQLAGTQNNYRQIGNQTSQHQIMKNPNQGNSVNPAFGGEGLDALGMLIVTSPLWITAGMGVLAVPAILGYGAVSGYRALTETSDPQLQQTAEMCDNLSRLSPELYASNRLDVACKPDFLHPSYWPISSKASIKEMKAKATIAQVEYQLSRFDGRSMDQFVNYAPSFKPAVDSCKKAKDIYYNDRLSFTKKWIETAQQQCGLVADSMSVALHNVVEICKGIAPNASSLDSVVCDKFVDDYTGHIGVNEGDLINFGQVVKTLKLDIGEIAKAK